MAKLYKIEMYILDINEQYDNVEDIIIDCENNIDVYFNCFNVEEKNIDWHDDIDINYYNNQTVDNYRKYF